MSASFFFLSLAGPCVSQTITLANSFSMGCL